MVAKVATSLVMISLLTGLASNQAADATRTLTQAEAAALFGGILDRTCGKAEQCNVTRYCDSTLTGATCETEASNWEEKSVAGANGRDCSVVQTDWVCDEVFPQEDCIKKYGCVYNETTNTCAVGTHVISARRAPEDCFAVSG